MRGLFVVIVLSLLGAMPGLSASPHPAAFAPPDADTGLALSVPAGELGPIIAGFTLSGKATLRVLSEQGREFATQTGFNPLDITWLAVMARRGGDRAPVLVARVKLDIDKVARALGPLGEAAKSASQPGGIRFESVRVYKGERVSAVSSEGALEVFADGLVVLGPKEAVARGVASPGAKAEGTILADLERHLGAATGIVAMARFPGGVADILPAPLASGIPPGLQTRARAIALKVGPKSIESTVRFDSTDAATVARPILPGLFNQIQSVVAQHVLAAKEQSRAQAPFGALDGNLIKARAVQEIVKDLIGAIEVRESGVDLVLTVDREKLDVSPAALGIVGVLAAIAVPNFRAARDRAQQRACFAGQKVLSTAIEMYRADKGPPGEVSLDPGFLATLQKGGYLKQLPRCPTDPGTSYRWERDGVACPLHGNTDGTVKGSTAEPQATGER